MKVSDDFMLDIAICDDNTNDNNNTCSLIKNYLDKLVIEHRIYSFSNSEEMFNNIENEGFYDIIFLDIFLNNENGIDILEKIRKDNKNVKVILTTSSTDFAIKAFELDAVHYIVKPINEKLLNKALDKAIKQIKLENANDFILIKTSEDIKKVKAQDIIYIESQKNYVSVHLNDGTSYKMRETIKEFWEKIDEYKQFLFIHRGYIINIDYVKSINKNNILLQNNVLLPMPKNKFSEIYKKIVDTSFE